MTQNADSSLELWGVAYYEITNRVRAAPLQKLEGERIVWEGTKKEAILFLQTIKHSLGQMNAETRGTKP